MKLRSRTIGVLSAIVTLASAGGLVALYAPSDARAAGETDSAVTVKWAGGNGDLQQFQPDRSHMVDNADGSGHWDDFKDLEVTVSQTEGLIDQTVTVTAAGMAPTEAPQSGRRNFLQLLQCWGDDPLAADFAKTCQYGGHAWPETGGGPSAFQDLLNDIPAVARGTNDSDSLKFRAATGDENEPIEAPLPGEGGAFERSRGLSVFFDRSSSNEVPYVPVSSDGTVRTSFIAQSAAAQPYLGCGDPATAGERCWLVVVPRGIHSGTFKDGETRCGGNRTAANAFGGTPSRQMGSPIGPDCTFWDNRMVLPMDFQNPFVSCAGGSAERRVVGSELIAEAMSSWQPVLCAGDDGATFSANTNSGNLARSQLLTEQADMVAVGRPLTSDNIGSADPALLRAADLGYAPLANSALTIGFIADEQDGTLRDDIRLTPRMIAKLLTQSYRFDLAQKLGEPPQTTIVGESYAVLKWDKVTQDEEWIALGNPTNFGNSDRAAWVVSGPRGDDAIRQLWEYVQADADAVAYLKGEKDPWGNVVNPYYLPSSHPDAAGDGYPQDLSEEPADIFPKADQSKFPDLERAEEEFRGLQLDSSRYLPFSETLEANAVRIARADKKLTTEFDNTTVAGWVSNGPMPPGVAGGRLILGPTLAPSAERYGLPTASLSLPLGERTTTETVASAREFVAYDEESMARALEHASLDDEGITSIEVDSLPTGAYPLTTTIHAAVDLSPGRLDRSARADYAQLLEYAATDGNVVSGDRGGLPEGYAPLTAAQQAAALDLADRLLVPPVNDSGPGGNGPGDNGDDGDDGGSGGKDAPGDSADPGDAGPGDTEATVPVPEGGDDPADGPHSGPGADGGPEGDPTTTQNEAAATEETAPLAASVALGGTLVAGLAGLVGAPFLMRRRDLTG